MADGCGRIIHIPFPTHRLARTAIGTLAVDEELSPLVKRSFSLVPADPKHLSAIQQDLSKVSLNSNGGFTGPTPASHEVGPQNSGTNLHRRSNTVRGGDESRTVLKIDYKATTNRMLRVAVNGFFESLSVVIQVMEELDVDVLQSKTIEDLGGVQGVEQGMTGTTITGA